MSILGCIPNRVSSRTFYKEPLSSDLKDKIVEYAKSLDQGPFGHRLSFSLLTNEDPQTFKKLGTYGMVRGATEFLVASINQGLGSLVDFGFLVEHVVLRATELGVGSCWLGGSFSKKSFRSAIDVKDGELLPAVIALGIAKEKRSLVDSFVRYSAKSKTRKPATELFFEKDFSTPLESTGPLETALEMVRFAPSASNQQPWRIIRDGDVFHFFVKRSERYQKMLKRFELVDLQLVDMGIALAHFKLAAIELGLVGHFDNARENFSGIDAEYIISWFS